MKHYLIVRRNLWPSSRELEAMTSRASVVAGEMAADVRWIHSYILAEEDGSFGAVCVYQATSEDKVREHAACAGLLIDEVILVADRLDITPNQTQTAA